MDMTGYIEMLFEFNNLHIKIGDTALLILISFFGWMEGKNCSTYQIYSQLKKRTIPEIPTMAYKNVHKIIQRLEALQLIEKIESRGAQHGAIYYRLTEAGIYRLFLSGQFTDSRSLKYMLKNYPNSAFFKRFLFPYFEQETLTNLTREIEIKRHTFQSYVILRIFQYLRMCCIVLEKYVVGGVVESRKSKDGTMIPSGLARKDDLLKNVQTFDIDIQKELYSLISQLINSFGFPGLSQNESDFNAIKILSLDNKFTKNVDDLYTHLEKGYKKFKHIREKSRL